MQQLYRSNQLPSPVYPVVYSLISSIMLSMVPYGILRMKPGFSRSGKVDYIDEQLMAAVGPTYCPAASSRAPGREGEGEYYLLRWARTRRPLVAIEAELVMNDGLWPLRMLFAGVTLTVF